MYNQLYIWKGPTWMIFQKGTFSYREVAGGMTVQQAETTAIQSGRGTAFADYVGTTEETGNIFCFCLS